jgi:hypothetical protein
MVARPRATPRERSVASSSARAISGRPSHRRVARLAAQERQPRSRPWPACRPRPRRSTAELLRRACERHRSAMPSELRTATEAVCFDGDRLIPLATRDHALRDLPVHPLGAAGRRAAQSARRRRSRPCPRGGGRSSTRLAGSKESQTPVPGVTRVAARRADRPFEPLGWMQQAGRSVSRESGRQAAALQG